MATKKRKEKTRVETLKHEGQRRTNIPTAELARFVQEDEEVPVIVEYSRKHSPNEEPEMYERNPDLDPQLVWKGKEKEDSEALKVEAVPIYIQKKIHPKVIIDDLLRQSKHTQDTSPGLFSDFNDLTDQDAKLEFYCHDRNWVNRLILGDSLQVMGSLAEKEGMRDKVQCIYLDPPYGIKFNSNFQWSTKTHGVKDGNKNHVSREPEQIRAFRDTWFDGVHSYLTYLRDRLTVARDLLTDSGSIFVQIGDENVHLVRTLLDEVFGASNFISLISYQTTAGFPTKYLANMSDFIIWYAKDRPKAKIRKSFYRKTSKPKQGNYWMFEDFKNRGVKASEIRDGFIPKKAKLYKPTSMSSPGEAKEPQPFVFQGKKYHAAKNNQWKANYPAGMQRVERASRVHVAKNSIQYVRYHDDFSQMPHGNIWTDTGTGNFTDEKIYVVQTGTKVIERCILMTTDPGDLVLDPTCGSGTAAYGAERWGRRWVAIDTSRVALTLACHRMMSARFPYYLMKDSMDGAQKEGKVSGALQKEGAFRNDLRHGFVYEREKRITIKSIANNAEIDVIWEKAQASLEPLLKSLNDLLKEEWHEWQVPAPDDQEVKGWSPETLEVHTHWWELRWQRQTDIDESIARNADSEYLYNKPFEKPNTVRVTGPFTMESLSPHRVVPTDMDDEVLQDELKNVGKEPSTRLSRRPHQNVEWEQDNFLEIVRENLLKAGVQNTKKGERLEFSSIKAWAGSQHVHFEGRYAEGGSGKRAAIVIGPEYGTISRKMIVDAAREAIDMFDVLVICGFAFEAHADKDHINVGNLTVLRCRMNHDLRMGELKKTASANLFVVFGEPDIALRRAADNADKWQVEIKGVDIFDPTTGEVKSSGPEDIACWFIDTDYDEESFFVRHAYFTSGGDPYKRLKTALKSEIDEVAWASLYSPVSRPFDPPKMGKIAVQAINHYGDEVLKVFTADNLQT